MPQGSEAVAWLNDEAAARTAQSARRSLWGAAPEIVRRVHDKAFAQRLAQREGLQPAPLRGVVQVLEPGALRPDDAGVEAIARCLEALPAWARESFTLKPRLGSSGRGRVAGSAGVADTPAIRGALGRLAARGGALLEPWLQRREDLSAQLLVEPDGAVRLLGTTTLEVTPAGVYRGQRGLVDAMGRVVSGSEHDEALREAAAIAAAAAAAEGFRGPCGVDAFSFEAPEGSVFRPLVEFNARFSAGLVTIGLLRQQIAVLRRHFAPHPEQRIAFHFRLSMPSAWSRHDDEILALPLGTHGAGLACASSADALKRALGRES